MIRHLPWILAFLVGAVGAAPEDELLPADQAFQLTTRADSTSIQATWRIAPGYYLYRDKFRFEALDPALRLGTPSLPHGKTKNDPYFGRAEIYFKSVTATIPIERLDDIERARVRIIAQGCNEPVGVCYPPITKEITLALPPVAKSGLDTLLSPRSGGGGLGAVRTVGGQPHPSLAVDPEQAFRVDAIALDAHTLGVRMSIDDCCYLYRKETRFNLFAPDGTPLTTSLRLGAFDMPAGETITDEFVGRTEIYRRGFDLRLPLLGAAPASGFALEVTYQGCADKGVKICYDPTTRRFPISTDGGSLIVGTGQTVERVAYAAAPSPSPPARQTGRAGDLFWAMLGAFGAGLLLTFTPCVLPMIPILSSVLVGAEGTRLNRVRGGLLSYTYVLGTALTYTVAGAVAGATGEQLQAYFQNPWAIGAFSAILVLFALSMFGLYEIQIPQAIQSFLHHHSTRVHHKSKRSAGGEFLGVFVLGIFSALIVGACVTPVLGSALAGAIATKDTVKGASIMFALANGQGAVLVAIGVSEGLLLPRSGPWMDTVKHVFGVLLVAVAIYLLGALPEVPVLLLWGALFIICGVYLGATQTLARDAGGWRHLWKGAGTLLLVWGILATIGGFAGNRDVLRPLPFALSGLTSAGNDSGTNSPATSVFYRVATAHDLNSQLAAARRAGKPVILDYYATWCTDCVRMERSTLRDTQVRDAIARGFVALQADVSETNDDTRAMKQQFGVFGPPAMLFLSSLGDEAKELRAYGYQTPDTLLEKLARFRSANE